MAIWKKKLNPKKKIKNGKKLFSSTRSHCFISPYLQSIKKVQSVKQKINKNKLNQSHQLGIRRLSSIAT